MKANELMIGDFLRYKQDFPFAHLQGKIVKVCGIDGRVDVRTINDGIFHESEHPNWLEPIPLTPDMLLTNGFELQEMGGGRVAIWTGFGEDNCHDIEVEFDGDKPIHLKIDGPIYLVTPNIKYLHQLQNFLRDCETGKEIKL